MQERFDFSEYSRKVYQVSKSLMASGHHLAEISGRMHLIAVAAERDLIRYAEPFDMSRVACAKGCGACCVLNVSILFPEAIAITSFLKRRFTQDELEGLRDSLSNLQVKTRWLDDEERVFLREPCAFLDEQGCCMIHCVRPLLCRSITSTNPSRCSDAITLAPLGEAPPIEMNLFQKRLVETVYQALAQALQELGLDYRPKRLTSAVLALMTDPELVETFAAGESISLH